MSQELPPSLPATGPYASPEPELASTEIKTPPASGVALVPGLQPVAGYTLVARLGRGGFGEVWSATGPGGFRVAMKFIPLEHKAGTVELRSLELMKEIRHPHLLPLFGAWNQDGYLIIAMELATTALYECLKEAVSQGHKGIAREKLLTYMQEAAKGIDHLNSLNVMHRDIKPQNLLLVGGSVKVADFGLARLMEQSILSASGAMTPAYAAPEFLSGKVSTRSDQYCLAATYCHLRGNALPFTGTVAEVITGHLTKAPNLSMLPEPERPIVAKGLAKNPDYRWPSCLAFVEALQNAVRGIPTAIVAEEPEGDFPTVPERPRRSVVPAKSSSGKIWFILAGLVILLVVGLAIGMAALPHLLRSDTKSPSATIIIKEENYPEAVVRVQKVQPQERKLLFTPLRGNLQASRTVDVAARVDGFVMSLTCKEGMEVKKGDVLLRLDDRDAQAALRRVEAELQRSKTAQELAEREVQRAEQLLATQAIAQADYDRAIETAKTRAAETKAAQVLVDQAKAKIADCQVVAPSEGLITKVDVVEGEAIRTVDFKRLVQITLLQPLVFKRELDRDALLLLLNLPQDSQLSYKVSAIQNKNLVEEGPAGKGGLLTPREWTIHNTNRAFRPDTPVWFQLMALTQTYALPKSALDLRRREPGVWLVSNQSKATFVKVGVAPGEGETIYVVSRQFMGELSFILDGQKLVEGQNVRLEK
jgi:RND family efflux transporter MFP subunit